MENGEWRMENGNMKDEIIKSSTFVVLENKIVELLENARSKIVTNINTTMVYTNFEIGRYIVEYEQNGKDRAEYGKAVLKNLSQRLTTRFGKGYSEDNLGNMRKFYLCYNEQISETSSRKFTLSWSHYLKLIRIQNADERNFYEIEATQNNWSLRELERQFDSSLYERLSLSKDKEAIKELALQGQIIEKPEDLIKDPYIYWSLRGFQNCRNIQNRNLNSVLSIIYKSFCWNSERDLHLLGGRFV